MKYSYIEIIKSLLFCLSKSDKKEKIRFISLVFFVFIGSLLEILSIASIIPFVSVLIDPMILKNINLISFVYENNFLDENNITFHVTFFFVSSLIIANIFKIFVLYFNHFVSRNFSVSIAKQIYSKLIYLDYQKIISSKSSFYINTVGEKINQFTGLVYTIIAFFVGIINLISIIIFFLIVNTKITFLILLSFPLIYLLISLTTKKILINKGRETADAINKKYEILQETFGGMAQIKINNLYEFFIKIFEKNEFKFRRSEIIANTIIVLPKFIIETLGITILAITCYFLFTNSIIEHSKLITSIAVVAFAAQRVLPIFSTCYQSLLNIISNFYITKDIESLLKNNFVLKFGNKSLDFKKKLQLVDVSFKYSLREESVFSNINLEILKGKHIGIVGNTGTGKTSLVNLILGLLYPNSGQILIDGNELNQENMISWQKYISYVPQDIFLNDTSIKNNITFNLSNNIDQAKLEEAIKVAQLEEFVNSLSQGTETIVGEKGLQISGGQKQRIGIARALYSNTEILILDEATSALDFQTEKRIIDEINKKRQITIIQISHKIINLKNCDEIIKINQDKSISKMNYHEIK
jgi:ATP-binding cassette, subfamily B, bacterial PglK